MTIPIAVAFGDDDAPAVMDAVLHLLREAGADITVESIEVGKRIYDMEGTDGVLPLAWPVLQRTNILLKAPTTEPPEHYTDVGDAIRAKMGPEFSLFESKDVDFSGMLNAALLMLKHIGQEKVAARIEAAWKRAQGQPFETPMEFAEIIAENLTY